MSGEAQTQPMLETLIRELREFRATVLIRLDKIEAIALEARAIAQETQLDIKKLREQLNVPA